MKKFLFLVSVLLFSFGGMVMTSQAQDWVSMMQDHNTNFHDVQKAFNTYYEKAQAERTKAGLQRAGADADAEENEENEIPGFTQFKRWEWFMAPRVSATGERFAPDQTYNEFKKYNDQRAMQRGGSGNQVNTGAGNWTLIGPVATGGVAGAGRINAVRVHPNDSNIIYACAPAGGLWKSTNAGVSWTTNTDWVSPVIGCTDLAFDPTNANIMYLATGDGDAGDTYSVGLLKSVDGGNTWAQTGLIFGMGVYRQLSRVLINPNNGSVILVATSGGLFRSDDAGATFSMVISGSYKDMEFKPGDPNTVYAAGVSFIKSTDGGINWTTITSGLPVAATLSRMAIAVTPADPTVVYLSAGLAAPNYGQDGFYRSNNSGTNFSKISVPSNMGNQQWYDLAIGASPTNAQEVMIGGQTIFLKSTNAGVSWSTIAGTTHVDYHDVIYASPTTCYIASDGGVYKSTNAGSAWTNINKNLTIAQIYGFGQSSTNAGLNIQGWQDNGTNKSSSGTFSSLMGGDGMLAFVDWNNDANMWGSQYNGSLNKSTNGGVGWSACKGNITGTGAWVTPWLEDPVTANTIYAGFNDVWKHTSGGGTSGWTKKSTFSSGTSLSNIAISPADNQVIYATDGSKIYRTANGGTSWLTLTVPAGTVTYIACSYTDANKAWLTYSGFTGKLKVYQTVDQGVTWTDLASSSLPNIPVNCIVVDKNATDGLYIGTDVGVFYKDASLNVWQPFYNALPNVPVSQLAIFYPTGKIRASTYGRGMWESDLYASGSYPPTANFAQDNTVSCPGIAIQFTDYSSGLPTSWNWSFPGGTPSSSTQQNPLVVYNTAGNYSVTLTVTNGNGSDTRVSTNLLSIASSPYSAPTGSSVQFCAPKTVNLSATGTGLGTIRWWDAAGGGNQVGTGNSISPTLTSTTSYYIDEDFPSGALDGVGEAFKNIGTGMYFVANDIRGLYFDVHKPVILNKVQVYSNSAGNRTIEIIDGQGGAVAETTLYIPSSPNTLLDVTLNLKLYPGTDYFIKCRGLVDLWRNDAGASYPYVSNNNTITITGSNANGSPGYYYYFYNWECTEIVCNTARSLVLATDTCNSVGIQDLFAQGTLEIFPNPNNGLFNLSFFVQNRDNYQINITNALGQAIYRKNLRDFAGTYSQAIDIGDYGKGMYMLSITNSKNETVKKVVVY